MTSDSTATTMVNADTKSLDSSSSTPSSSTSSNDKDKDKDNDKDNDNSNTPSSSTSNGSPPNGGSPPASGTNANNPDASTDTGTTGTTTGPGTLPTLIGSTTKCDNFTQTGKCGGGGGKGGGGTKPKPTGICPEGSHLKDGKCTPCHYDNGVNGSQTCVYVEKKIIERHTSHYVGGSSSSSKSKGLRYHQMQLTFLVTILALSKSM